MITNALRWPALEGLEQEVPSTIACERGIFGKAHGSASDYHWLAMTPHFTAARRRLEQDLELGEQDEPSCATLWRSDGDVSSAINFYPSRAHDASGRSGFLEKQVLEWKRPPNTPAALGALMLLPMVARLDADDWWKQRSDVQWSSDDVIDLTGVPPIPTTMASIEKAIVQGLDELARAVSEDGLTEFYANVLAGNRGIAMRGVNEPLSPVALAALLLPLPRKIADAFCAAAWLPSTWLSESTLQNLRRCWTAIIAAPVPVASVGSEPTAEQIDEARALAGAISARRAPTRVMTERAQAASEPTVKPVQLALWGPIAAGKSALLAKLFMDAKDEQWDVFPTQQSLEFINGMRLRMRTANQFPMATTPGHVQTIEYVFVHRQHGVTASLQMEDRAGLESEELKDEEIGQYVSLRKRLSSADGLVLLFDPMSDEAVLENRVLRTLELLHVASERTGRRDPRPMAICVSKADRLIQRPRDFTRALESPDEFVRERVAPVLVSALDRYCGNYRLFPISAAGVRLRHGVIEPAVFIDENFSSRICPGGSSFNLMAPFSWLLNQLTRLA